MSLAMTIQEREAYLAEVHVAILSVADDGGRVTVAVQNGEPRPEHRLTRDYTKVLPGQ